MYINFKSFDAFVFDLDGTLLDSGGYHAQAFATAVFEQSGYRITAEESREFFASHSTLFAQCLNQRYELGLVPDQVLARKRIRMIEIFKSVLFDGAREFLEQWQGIKPMGLATNSPALFVNTVLKELNLTTFFDAVITADDVTDRKPHPEMMLKVVDQLQVDPAKVLVFEDQLIGITAAQKAGTKVVAIENKQQVIFPENMPVMTWKELLEQ